MADGTETGARALAARVLARTWDEGAFAAAALDAEIRRRAELDPRDAALATELVYGVLRTEGYLRARLEALATKRHLPELAAEARAELFAAAYSILFLDRIPAFAAVSEGVRGVSAAAGPRVGGFAHAVLRQLAAAVERGGRPAIAPAVVASAPGWLRGALRRSLGRSGAAAYLAAGPVPPPIGLSVARAEEREAWIERLRAAAPAASIEAGHASPHAILVRGAGDVRRLPGAEGDWIIQEEGAQLVALALGARPGERVLDACAGRGNKVWLLRHGVGEAGAVDAADLYAPKLERLATGARAGWARATYAVDWTAGTGEVPEGYDRVLVDAPCTGTGTLRRRPEIAMRRTPDDVARLAEIQRLIARRAATRVRSGGRLVVAVCSVLREEAEELAAALALPAEPGAPTLEPVPFDAAPVAAIAGEGATTLRLLPHVHGTDGYFVASFLVRR